MPPILYAKNLTKHYSLLKRRPGVLGALKNLILPKHQTIHAVEQVSFSLEEGEIVGYLGPNGAGKSTTIKMLTGLLVPTSGEAWVNGYIPWKDRTRYVREIGVVFGNRPALWWDLPVIDSLELLEPMYRISHSRFVANLKEFSAILGLEPFLNTPVRSLSLGERMRADLCAALIHEPRILFLDEPTVGLDVVAKEHIRQAILHIRDQRGVTVLLTTHDLSDVERLCERVLILDQGKLLFDGSLDTLNSRFEGLWTLRVDFQRDYSEVFLPGAIILQREGAEILFGFDHRHIPATDLIRYLFEHYAIADIEIKRPPLEETIRRIYNERLLMGSITE